MKRVMLLFLIPFFIVGAERDSTLDTGRLALIAGATTTAFVYGHSMNTNMWWKGEKSSFHFEWDNDWRYALGADKLGHMFFPYLTASLYSDILQWANVPKKESYWWAAGIAFSYQTYIEIKDGFSKEWGFSWGDFAANSIGAAYPVLSYYYPALRNYQLKVSYYPSERFKNNSHEVIIDDYESTYHWLSIPVNLIIPKDLRIGLPDWLRFAVGHSVRKLDLAGERTHELYLALDLDPMALSQYVPFLRPLLRTLSFYKLPAPAVKIYPDVIWYGLRF